MKAPLRARFRALTIVQIVLLLASTSLVAWSLLASDWLAVPGLLIAVVAVQTFVLIRYVEAHVETLEEFFAAVNYEDFTRRFVADDLDAELKTAFNRILTRFADARAERDVQASYLQTVVRHVPVPFIAARTDGALTLVNNPARRLTGIATLGHLDQLGELDPRLPALLRAVEPGERQLVQTRLRNVPVELRVSAAEIRIQGEIERLYAIENLSGELTAREGSAWRNLLRVLTHEIMNTLTPVTSLAQTCSALLARRGDEADGEIREAVDTIARRSSGLMDFVANYRELMQVLKPQRRDVIVADAVEATLSLMRADLAGVAVRVDVVPASLTLRADPTLFDQVLLNLVKNAIDALADARDPRLEVRARLDFGRVLVQVVDNGPGIPEAVLDQIFVPFFTTKADGSGIGLSLTRQIMTAHGGEVAVTSDAGGTTVTLIFP